MKLKFFLSAFFAALILLMASCGGPSPANNAGNANNSNTNIAGIPSPSKKPETETLNNAPTLGPVVQQYYDALRTKNDAELRDTLTRDFVKRLEEDMREDNWKQGFAAYVAKDEYRPDQPVEVRNEKIQGDKGVAELKGGPYKNWTPFEFAKEEGKWKFTGGSPDIDVVNSNSSR
ncbi:MAG TPA: hypothetical protein VEV84_03620 [Pyrinomonadaceae bacterium]|nr:hypothetical protein [Pyrinomonadaceae bacterium]